LSRFEPGHALAERLDDSGTVGPEDAWLRHGRKTFANPNVEMVERRGSEADQDFAGAWRRVGYVFENENMGAAVLMDTNRLHGRHTIRVTASDLERCSVLPLR
jgi:hypothetical protein